MSGAAPVGETIVIEPSGAWSALRLREVWDYRELGLFLAWRDIKIRYKQSVLGAAWAIIQPLVTMLIFTALLGRLGNQGQKGIGDVPMALATYSALVAWTFFSASVIGSGNSLVGSSHLISKVYFPRVLLPAATITAALLDFAIALGFLIPLSFFYGRPPTLGPGLLLLPALVLLLAVLALGVGLWMSALNVKYRDVRYALPFLMQAGMFASPVFFSLRTPGVVPEHLKPWMLLNPMTGVLEGFRSALFGLPILWSALGASAILALILLAYGLVTFRRMESSFADVI